MREMKDSGQVFLGKVPASWTPHPAGGLFKEIKEKNTDLKYTNPLQFKYGTIIDKSYVGDLDESMKETLSTYTCVEPNTIMINGLNLNYDFISQRVAIVRKSGVITSAYLAIYPDEKKIKPEYACYLLKGYDGLQVFHGMGSGVRKTLQWKDFKNIVFIIPSTEEQAIIIEAINRKLETVDALIANQEAQIEKLKQYKQSLITEVVTKGLDSDAPMKDSGVESIGKVPVHWSIKRTKFVAESLTKGNGITKEEVFDDGDIQCVRYGEIYSKYDCAFTTAFSRTKSEIIASPQSISYGDLLFAGTGELVEEIGKNIVYLGSEPCLAGGDIIVLKHSQHPEFLNYALYGSCSQLQKSKGKAKLKVVHISASEIGNVIVALPPIDEQKKIAIYLNEKCDMINRVIANKRIKIEKLNQYKKSLIYEYVTGKKEVI